MRTCSCSGGECLLQCPEWRSPFGCTDGPSACNGSGISACSVYSRVSNRNVLGGPAAC